jgi:DnaJ-class molecular chaperone
MGREKSTGGILGALFGFGKSVKYKRDWLGRTQKIVTHRDSGNEIKSTYGTGFFWNTTRIEKSKNGKVFETGHRRRNFLWGSTERSERTDGSRVKRTYSPGLFYDSVSTEISGSCHGCNGTGTRDFECRNCHGTGAYRRPCHKCSQTGGITIPERECFRCNGKGMVNSNDCTKCSGTGIHKAHQTVTCNKCIGAGSLSSDCRNCSGNGRYKPTCKKCYGTAQYYKFS